MRIFKKLFICGSMCCALSFTSCSFEQAINTLSKTGVNVFTGNSVVDQNVSNAVDSMSTIIDSFDENLSNVGENVDNAVQQFNEDGDLLSAAQNILGTVSMTSEECLDLIEKVSRASLTEDGMKEFAKSVNSVTIPLEKSKAAVVDAMTGLRDCLSSSDFGEVSEIAVDIINGLLDESEGTTYEVAFSDVLIISMLSTTVCDAIEMVKNLESPEDAVSAVLNNGDLISEVFGVFQVANAISQGSKAAGEDCSKFVEAVANIAVLLPQIMNLAV